MSASTPASANAFVSNGRSAPSQRADEAVSGKITPTLAFLAAGVEVPDDDDDEPPEELSLPQAAPPTASTAAAATGRTPWSFISAPPAGHRPATGRGVR